MPCDAMYAMPCDGDGSWEARAEERRAELAVQSAASIAREEGTLAGRAGLEGIGKDRTRLDEMRWN